MGGDERTPGEGEGPMGEIEESIERVETLYRAVTGRNIPMTDEVYAPIPAEKDPAVHVQEQIDRLFQMLGHEPAVARTPPWAPPIAVWEAANEVLVFVDVPGVSRDRIELALQGNVLSIAGDRPAPIGNGHRLRFGERPIGAFRRSVPLPPALKTAELTARLRDGVLEVVIPRDVGPGGVANSRPVPIA
jgi:HSP20 family molecular chaperone IbpA